MSEVIVYYKDYCPYCKRARALLDELGQEHTDIDIEGRNDLREEMIAKANGSHTVPQIFIDGQHVGGCDDLFALHDAGKLLPMLGK